MEKRRDRGRGHRRRRQPAVEGEDRRLDAEAEEAQHEYGHELLFVALHLVHIEDAAVGEGEGIGIAQEVHEADKHQGRARHGVEHVLFARGSCLAVHLVHDERQGDKGHELIAEIEGKEVCGVSNARHHPEGDEEEAEEHVLPSLMLHVGEGVDGGHGPENADDAAEDEAHAVRAEGDHELVREIGHMQVHRIRAVEG